MAEILPGAWATFADFELTFGTIETLELSELEDPGQTVTNTARIQNFLDQAQDLITAKDRQACNQGKVLIRQNIKRLHLDIARYYADVLKLRPDVKERYEVAFDYLQNANSNDVCATEPPAEDLILFNIGVANRILNENGEEELGNITPRLKFGLFRW